MQRKYQELGEQHAQQMALVRAAEGEKLRARTYKDTIASQEKVIAKLEALLATTARDRSEKEGNSSVLQARLLALESDLEGARRTIDSLQAALDRSRAQGEAAGRDLVGRDEAALLDLKSELHSALEERDRLAEDRLVVLMRAEQAEARLQALNSEMMDLTKRYGKEIAALKSRLAEKEAQIQGGFGSFADLALGRVPANGAAGPAGPSMPVAGGGGGGGGGNPAQAGAFRPPPPGAPMPGRGPVGPNGLPRPLQWPVPNPNAPMPGGRGPMPPGAGRGRGPPIPGRGGPAPGRGYQ